MNNEERTEMLAARGYKIAKVESRENDGALLLLIDNTFMFEKDADELALGTATMDQIVERNNGKVFPDAPAVATSASSEAAPTRDVYFETQESVPPSPEDIH
jgi:hypothetical protein